MSRAQTLRARRELRQARTYGKHTKTARRVHDKAEAALFAVIKARDEQRRIEHIIDNAAEHTAAIVKGE